MINWKLRFMNKATLCALISLVVGLIYIILSWFDVVPKVSESDVINALLMLVDILSLVGVVTDPTTEGVIDSIKARSYQIPKKFSDKYPIETILESKDENDE